MHNVGDFTHWLGTLDPKEILYALVATIATILATIWSGIFRRSRRYVLSKKALHSYRKNLKQTCSSLIVIGRKQGFSMEDVYVSLDVAISDLNSTPSNV